MPKPDLEITGTYDFVFCPHCAAKNPKKAYVCLNCFKVMFPTSVSAIAKFRVPPSISITVIFAALVLAGLHLANRWLAGVEGNMTLHVRTSEYNLAVTADKRRNEDLQKDIELKKITDELSGSTQP